YLRVSVYGAINSAWMHRVGCVCWRSLRYGCPRSLRDELVYALSRRPRCARATVSLAAAGSGGLVGASARCRSTRSACAPPEYFRLGLAGVDDPLGPGARLVAKRRTRGRVLLGGALRDSAEQRCVCCSVSAAVCGDRRAFALRQSPASLHCHRPGVFR